MSVDRDIRIEPQQRTRPRLPRVQGPLVSIVITTRNRREDLLRALESCAAQNYQPLEILVYDDASTDGTEAAVRREFPDVKFDRQPLHRGYIVLRDRAFREADGEIVVSIDDDAYFSSTSTIADIVRYFETADARVAAVAIPYLEPAPANVAATGQSVLHELNAFPVEFRSFVGCAHAVRRETARQVGGYRSCFGLRQGEERDLSIRLLSAGHAIGGLKADPIVHVPSARRNQWDFEYYGVRNTLLFDFLNVPSRFLMRRMAADTFRLATHKLSLRNIASRLAYVVGGWGACLKSLRQRRPVSQATFLRFRNLPRHAPIYCRPEQLPAPVTRKAAKA